MQSYSINKPDLLFTCRSLSVSLPVLLGGDVRWRDAIKAIILTQ